MVSDVVNLHPYIAAGLDALCKDAADKVRAGHACVIISDKSDQSPGDGYEAIQSLLAVGAVHHHLIAEGLRTR